MALQLLIDGVDHISELVHNSLKVNQTNDGLNSTCSFDIRDAGVIQANAITIGVWRVEDGSVITGHTTFPEPKVEVSVVDGATVYFAGILSGVTTTTLGQIVIGTLQEPDVQVLRCRCHDFTALLEESVIDTYVRYAIKTDEFVIDAIFTAYVTGIDFATHVTASYTFGSITFENITVRQAMDQIVARSGCVWYVDYSKKLHYSEEEANAPAWHLSDHPDDVNSFSFFAKPVREVDATNLINMFFIVSSVGATWFTDEASRAKYGDHKFIVRDERLALTESIAARGAELLDKFANPVTTYVVKTYKDGLRAGMNVRFVCAYLDVDDEFLINRLQIEFPVDGEPVYELTLGGLESSPGSAAQRVTLDQIYSGPPVAPGQLPVASRGWGHDLTFSATDNDTVAWGAGTITTAGGQTFAIGAGNTDDPGAMTAKTIVYLDTVISLTELQMTTDETAALGTNRIMVAVCWPSGEATVDAGFQVFGATGELATYLNATNVIADCITANEIYGNTLSVIAANMGLLTAGEIRMIGVDGSLTITPAGIKLFDGNDPDADNVRLILNTTDGKLTFQTAVVGSPHIVIDNTQIAGYDAANDVQFELDATDGKAYAGAGAVRLNKDGLQIVADAAAGNPEKLRFQYDDSGTLREMGAVFSSWGGGANKAITWLSVSRVAGDPWPAGAKLILQAADSVAMTNVQLTLDSGRTIKSTGEYIFKTVALLRPGTGASDPTNAVEDGCLFYRTDTDKLRLRANGAWVNLN